MKLAKRLSIAVLATVLVAGVVEVIAPRAVHAVVSALVTVANTSANPVITRDVDNGARQPVSLPGNCLVLDGFCRMDNLPVPVDKAFVITDVSGECTTSEADSRPFLYQLGTAFGPNYVTMNLTDVGVITNGNVRRYVFGRTTDVRISSSTVLSQSIRDATSGIGGTSCESTINGYFVNP